MTKLTPTVLLKMVEGAVCPDSNYIREHMRRNGLFYSPAAVLKRLNELCRDGLLERSAYPHGQYGYRWTITPAGRGAMEASDG